MKGDTQALATLSLTHWLAAYLRLSFPLPPFPTHTHIHTHAHTHIHTYTHTHIHPHTQDVHKTYRCTALLSLVALVKKHTAHMMRHLPSIVEAIICTLDPSEHTLRKDCLHASTMALHELVKRYPMVR